MNWSGFDAYNGLYGQVRGSFSNSSYVSRLAYRTKQIQTTRSPLCLKANSLELDYIVAKACVASVLVYVTLRDNPIEVDLISAVCNKECAFVGLLKCGFLAMLAWPNLLRWWSLKAPLGSLGNIEYLVGGNGILAWCTSIAHHQNVISSSKRMLEYCLRVKNDFTVVSGCLVRAGTIVIPFWQLSRITYWGRKSPGFASKVYHGYTQSICTQQ